MGNMFKKLLGSKPSSDVEISSGIHTFSDFNSSDDDDESVGAPVMSDTEDEPDLRSSGPTFVTVDDGTGGLKHIRVEKPPDSHSDLLRTPSVEKKKPPSKGGTALGEMIRKEYKGRSLFSVEPHGEKLHKRIVSKSGSVHVGRTRVSKRRRRYLSDFFNTMLDLKWRYVLIIFSFSFFGSWLLFACVWFIIAFIRGDFKLEHSPDYQKDSGWTPCVYQLYDFTSCLYFSIETQHTIGYGSRYPSEKCPEVVLLVSVQSVIGVMIQACMVGTIFAKLSRPKKRAQTLMFSRNAVVSLRDGYLCLLFRVGNMRMSHLVESHARAILINKKVTEEGEVIPYYQTDLKVGTDNEGSDEDIFFIWPLTVIHRIDEDSPFYHMSARDFFKKRYEIIVVLEGIVEPTGMSIQARSSYLPSEILWGHRFCNVLNYDYSQQLYMIDYSSFNSVYRVKTPICSGKTLAEEKKDVASNKESGSRVTSNWSLSSASKQGRYKVATTHINVTPSVPSLRTLNYESRDREPHTSQKSLHTNIERFF